MAENLNRREFLKRGAGLAVGIGGGLLLIPTSTIANETVTQLTGIRSGNAAIWSRVEDYCDRNPGTDCLEEYKESRKKRDILAPHSAFIGFSLYSTLEEAIFRILPSLVLDQIEKPQSSEHTLPEGGFAMTRKEITFGFISSVLFGLAHNIVSDGFDKKTIPASQTICGAAFWYLQRKFGAHSNILAHTVTNFGTYYSNSI
jgi:hypothetical protein